VAKSRPIGYRLVTSLSIMQGDLKKNTMEVSRADVSAIAGFKLRSTVNQWSVGNTDTLDYNSKVSVLLNNNIDFS